MVRTATAVRSTSGNTYFGFFTLRALADQVGHPRGVPVRAPNREEQDRAGRWLYPGRPPSPTRRWRMIDRIERTHPRRRTRTARLRRGSTTVDPGPGSSRRTSSRTRSGRDRWGWNRFCNCLKSWPSRTLGGGCGARDLTFDVAGLGHRHRWVYRGQVLPSDRAGHGAGHDHGRSTTQRRWLRRTAYSASTGGSSTRWTTSRSGWSQRVDEVFTGLSRCDRLRAAAGGGHVGGAGAAAGPRAVSAADPRRTARSA